MNGLLLHCGDDVIQREALAHIPTPTATDTWQPIRHDDLLTQVEMALHRRGLVILQQGHAVSHRGLRYFGLLEISNGAAAGDYVRVIGVRNSADKRFPAGLVCGTQVIVCSNLAFGGGEIKVARKHTAHIMRDLPIMIEQAIGGLADQWRAYDARVEVYKRTRVTDQHAHHLTIKALDSGAITERQIRDVLKEWRTPSYPTFLPRTLWSWSNAITHELRGRLNVLPARSEALYRVCDAFAGLSAA